MLMIYLVVLRKLWLPMAGPFTIASGYFWNLLSHRSKAKLSGTIALRHWARTRGLADLPG